MDVFRVLGNENRRSMLRILMTRDLHVSALAKELSISVPVALKHVRVLEQANFVSREKVGNSHLVSINREAVSRIKSAYDLFDRPLVVEVDKGVSLLDALKKVASLSVKSTADGSFISGVDGKQGYYIYEVDGKFSEKPVDQFFVSKDLSVEFKRLLPVIGKKVLVKIKP